MTDEQFDKLCDFLEELVGENWNAFYNAKDDKLTICFHHEEVEPTFKPIAEVKLDKEQLQEIVDKAKAEVLASVERPKDTWHYYNNSNVNGYMHDGCECREEVFQYAYNFCPNCGAYMKKGEEE